MEWRHYLERFVGTLVILALAMWFPVMALSLWAEAHACGGGGCSIWQDVVLKSPNKPRGYINLGLSYDHSGHLDLALVAYQKAQTVAMDPSRPSGETRSAITGSTVNITDVLLRTGRDEEAHQILKEAWLAEPGFPGYAINLGLFYIREGSFDKAVAFLSEGIAEQDRYKWFAARGQLYLNRSEAYRLQGDCQHAAEDLREAQLDPDTRGIKPPDCIEKGK